jgi:hypothetical protein
MPDNKRETGVRIPKEDRTPVETDQNAGMPKMPAGTGLSRQVNEAGDSSHPSETAGVMRGTPEGDAVGAYAKTQHGGKNDGVASAVPKVISRKKSGDATFKHTYNGIDRE